MFTVHYCYFSLLANWPLNVRPGPSTVKVSQLYFGISLPSVVSRNRMEKFEQTFRLRMELLKAFVRVIVVVSMLVLCYCYLALICCLLPWFMVNKVEYYI